MLDIKFIRENKQLIKDGAIKKQYDPQIIDGILDLDEKIRELRIEVENLRAKRNRVSDEVAKEKDQTKRNNLITSTKNLKDELKEKEDKLTNLQNDFWEKMYWIPNPPNEDVPVGKDETGNVEVKKWGTIPKFDFFVKDHIALGEELDLIDIARGVKIGGFRSFFTKNDLLLMEYGLLLYALRHMIKQGFTPMTVPWLVKEDALFGTGYFPWGRDDHYKVQDDLHLIGTAEVSLTAYYGGEILNEKDLPVKLVGLSPCFRREVGSYGKDTRGIFRLHQFNKVEQVVLCKNDHAESVEWHEKMLKYAEEILQALKLPYRVMLMCTGDMGAGQIKKYDIETWYPAQGKYRETHSDSYFHDFQSRRLNLRYKTENGVKFVYTLNNTVIATPRVLGAILENYQQKDGSVTVPEILRDFVGKDKIVPKK
jgi:seryl-tRNA synthetase